MEIRDPIIKHLPDGSAIVSIDCDEEALLALAAVALKYIWIDAALKEIDYLDEGDKLLKRKSGKARKSNVRKKRHPQRKAK